MQITDETRTYLDGHGTEEQQGLFQRAAERIREIYREQESDAPEDEAGMTAEQLVGAAQYALGDGALEDLGEEARAAQMRYLAALDRLAGAMVAADLQGVPIVQIAERAHVTRPTVYKRLGR
jgi:DNA-directed RNA polymerase specialized sigma24 family protein